VGTQRRIKYTSDIKRILPGKLAGFFQGWVNPPDNSMHLKILKDSSHFIAAVDIGSDRMVGFITAITDKHLTAFIPLLEVTPDYRGRGIGKELVTRMLKQLNEIYSIDLVCDQNLQGFYEKSGFKSMTAMSRRNYHNQKGKE